MVKGDTMIIGSTKGLEVPDILEGIQTPEGLELRKKRITL